MPAIAGPWTRPVTIRPSLWEAYRSQAALKRSDYQRALGACLKDGYSVK